MGGGWKKRREGGIVQIPVTDTATEQRLDALERVVRSLRLEWEDVYDKLMKAAARLNARTRREKDEELPPPRNGDEMQPTPVGTGTHAVLSAARRGRRGEP